MCDQYNNRGCEVVDELHLEITNLEMTIADLKQEIVEDLKELGIKLGIDMDRRYHKLIKKWEAK